MVTAMRARRTNPLATALVLAVALILAEVAQAQALPAQPSPAIAPAVASAAKTAGAPEKGRAQDVGKGTAETPKGSPAADAWTPTGTGAGTTPISEEPVENVRTGRCGG